MKNEAGVSAKVKERRRSMINLLISSEEAISGEALAKQFAVSRQIVVQDIAALKQEGCEILSTRYGYMVRKIPYAQRVFKVWHTREDTKDELFTIVSLGGIVVDVFVWHRVYGKIEAPLNITNLSQVEQFLEGVRSGKSTELMSITGGYHYHTVRAESEEILGRIEAALAEKQLLVPELE